MGKVVLIACTSVGREIIEEIETNPLLKTIEIAGIVNLNPSVSFNKANFDSYSDLIYKYNIPVYYCQDVNEEESIEFMREKSPDIIIQTGWSQKFSSDILELPKYACIGEHPSPLPRGRGAACVNWAIINGEREWGDTFFKMEEKYDTGVIYAQKRFSIEHYDNVKTVYDKVKRTSRDIVRENILSWCKGEFEVHDQDESEVTYFKRRRPSDGYFDFNFSSYQIYNLVRAVTKPYPGAFFYAMVNGEKKKILVWDSKVLTQDFEDKSTHINYNNGSVNIGCSNNTAISLIRVQVEGDIEMWASELFDSFDIKLI